MPDITTLETHMLLNGLIAGNFTSPTDLTIKIDYCERRQTKEQIALDALASVHATSSKQDIAVFLCENPSHQLVLNVAHTLDSPTEIRALETFTRDLLKQLSALSLLTVDDEGRKAHLDEQGHKKLRDILLGLAQILYDQGCGVIASTVAAHLDPARSLALKHQCSDLLTALESVHRISSGWKGEGGRSMKNAQDMDKCMSEISLFSTKGCDLLEECST